MNAAKWNFSSSIILKRRFELTISDHDEPEEEQYEALCSEHNWTYCLKLIWTLSQLTHWFSHPVVKNIDVLVYPLLGHISFVIRSCNCSLMGHKAVQCAEIFRTHKIHIEQLLMFSWQRVSVTSDLWSQPSCTFLFITQFRYILFMFYFVTLAWWLSVITFFTNCSESEIETSKIGDGHGCDHLDAFRYRFWTINIPKTLQ